MYLVFYQEVRIVDSINEKAETISLLQNKS